MKTHKIYLSELSAKLEDGSRKTIKTDIVGTFPAVGTMMLCFNYLKDNVYNTLLASNDGTKATEHMFILSHD